MLRENVFQYALDYDTGAAGEAVRQVFQEMGYDGIIDNTVSEKFGPQRKVGKQMGGLSRSTDQAVQ